MDEAELGEVKKKKLWVKLFIWGEAGRRKGGKRVVKRKAKKGERDAEVWKCCEGSVWGYLCGGLHLLAAAAAEQGTKPSDVTLKQGLDLRPWSVGLVWARDGCFTSPVRECTDGWIKHPGITVSVPVKGLMAPAATHLFIMRVGFFPHMTSEPVTP